MIEVKHNSHLRFDVARGLMALTVLLAHTAQVFLWRLDGPDSLVAHASGALARHAVIVFFLLSGYLITRSIVHNIRRNSQLVLSEYLISRITRIYPPLMGAILLCLVVWAIIHAFHLPGAVTYRVPGDFTEAREAFTLRLSDIPRALTMRGGLLDADGPLWTLYIEFQLYLAAMLIAGWYARGWAKKLLCIGLGICGAYLLRDNILFVVLWGIGAAMELIPLRRTIAYWLLPCLLLGLGVLVSRHPELVSSLMDTHAGALLQLGFALVYALVLFSAYPHLHYPKALVKTGDFSYSLYVVHWPLLLLALSFTQSWIQLQHGRTAVVMLIADLAICAFAYVFARYAERQDIYRGWIVGGLRQAGIVSRARQP
jgi:peptidoglycan/LPS O-acetylase OafA/YrhL